MFCKRCVHSCTVPGAEGVGGIYSPWMWLMVMAQDETYIPTKTNRTLSAFQLASSNPQFPMFPTFFYNPFQFWHLSEWLRVAYIPVAPWESENPQSVQGAPEKTPGFQCWPPNDKLATSTIPIRP